VLLPDKMAIATALYVRRQPGHFGRRQRRLDADVVRRITNYTHTHVLFQQAFSQ